jgi:hypothetical protein
MTSPLAEEAIPSSYRDGCLVQPRPRGYFASAACAFRNAGLAMQRSP